MLKSDLIAVVADRLPHVPKKDVEDAINIVFDSMVSALASGERI